MQPVVEVAPHQAVAAPAENIQPGAAGHQRIALPLVAVMEALEPGLPPRILVQLVKHHQRQPLPRPVQPQFLRYSPGARQQQFSVLKAVPAEIAPFTAFPHRHRQGRLPHLPGAGDEHHLPIAREMLPHHRLVGPFLPRCRLLVHPDHSTHHRKTVKTILRPSIKQPAAAGPPGSLGARRGCRLQAADD